ncbi:MAG: M28 family peptidase [Ignavibacteria bacterium]|nr:M28 family peptidase [Ignavibacteria bacterium]
MLLLLIGCAPKVSEYLSTDITAQELRDHVKYLASDELRGRRTGEEGNKLAAAYIAGYFERAGLTPAGDHGSYFQNFSFIAARRVGESNSLSIHSGEITRRYKSEEEYRTLSFSEDTLVTAPVAFVGYGISAHDSLTYDDYASIHVKNKIVIALRYSPGGPGNNTFARFASLIDKSITAREKGAAAIVFLTGPPGKEGSELKDFLKQYNFPNSGIAAICMRWSDIDSLLRPQGKNLYDIQQHIDSTQTPSSFEIPNTMVTLRTQIIKVYSQSANVVGFLEGTDSTVKDQALVIGAHMDHLGLGGQGSGSLKPDTVAIHHGADDNASGTAGLIETAQYLASQRQSVRRSILFIAFTGEELGLFGSDYYVKHPFVPIERTIGMINMDMIGRMKDSTLVIEGMGTSSMWEELVKKENRDSLRLKLKPDGFGPSDHSSFYGKDIPVLFFFTNLHDDYHRPSDTWDKINYTGEQKVVEMVTRIAKDVSTAPVKPAFTKVVASAGMNTVGDRTNLRVSLGVIPDYADEGVGLKISGTRAGSAAEKAGLKANDVIIKLSGKEVKNIYDYMHVLEEHKPGDHIDVIIKRGSAQITLQATLEARQ